jgi:predicted dienelactone hydrolase
MPAPLILFSHGFHGCNTQSTFLMEALAKAGYLLMAPNHKDATCGGGLLERPEQPFQNPGSWNQTTYKARGDDIVRLLDAVRHDKQWSELIDWSRVGLAGHSLGGYTVLGLAGGWSNWKIPTVKVVLALSPYCDPFLQNGNLDRVGIAVMYQGGTRDIGITPSLKKSGGCFPKTSAPSYLVEFRGARHFAWTDLVADHHELINQYTIAFFDKHLRAIPGADPAKQLAGVSDLKVK